MITYNWKDLTIDYIASKEEVSDVIEKIHWRLEGVDGEINEEVYGVVALPDPNPSEFIPIEDVNRQLIIQWLEDILNQTSEDEKPPLDIYKKILEDKIEYKKNPNNNRTSINL